MAPEVTDAPFTIQLPHRLYFVKGTKINTKVLINQMLKLLLKSQDDAVSHSQCPHNTLFLLPFKVNIVKAELKSNNECPPSPCTENVKYLGLTQLVPKLCIKCVEAYCLQLAGELNYRNCVSQKADYKEVTKFGLSKEFAFSKSTCGSAQVMPIALAQQNHTLHKSVPRLHRHQEMDAQVVLIGGNEHTNTSLQPMCC